jgi:hypothetical protein
VCVGLSEESLGMDVGLRGQMTRKFEKGKAEQIKAVLCQNLRLTE